MHKKQKNLNSKEQKQYSTHMHWTFHNRIVADVIFMPPAHKGGSITRFSCLYVRPSFP